MKFFLFFIIALITYGSLYPFNFEALESEASAFQQILQTWSLTTHRGDILANIVLFSPLGFIGILTFAHHEQKGNVVSIILALGLVLGVTLQFAQLYLPSRDPNLTDAVWNLLGTIIGIFIGHYWRKSIILSRHWLHSSATVPMLLVTSWFCYRLMPFIPSIDWAQFKNSVKPLLLHPEFSWIGILHDTLAWAIIYLILPIILPNRNIALYIFYGLPTVFFLEIIIIENVVSLTNIVGAVLGISSGWTLRFFSNQYNTILATLLAVFLIINGLAPFNTLLTPNTFHWIPFHGYLGGSMLLNTSVLFEKFFLYGSFLWLLTQSGLKMRTAASIGFAVTFGIEIAQVYFGTHTAEITDPLLIVTLGIGISTFDSKWNHRITEPTDGTTRYSIKLKPVTTLLLNQIPAEGIDVNSMPFRIGRFESQDENLPRLPNQVSLRDYSPFQISRNHFTIDQNSRGLIIRDNGSRLGTVVNGVQIGKADADSDVAPLNIGYNEVVAGDLRSKFRFTIVVKAI